jgi:hypothetical protein
LAQGEKALGLLSDVLVLESTWLSYPADRILLKKPNNSLIRKVVNFTTLMKEVSRLRGNYDVFHFNFGTSLIDLWRIGLPLMDLPFYKKKGKIVVTYNGCDARQKYPTIKRVSFSACHNDYCYQGICNNGVRDDVKRIKISKFDRYADAIFAVNPDLLYFLPTRSNFLPYTIADWSQIETQPYRSVDRIMRIVHSPTNRMAKGSDLIIQALDLLKKRYGNILEVTLIENVPYRKAREIYAKADLAIDQILIGWYGGFAVEAMKMGKPVMAFIRKEDLKFLPQAMAAECEKAIIQADPSTIYKKIAEIIEDPSMLKTYRVAALDYVHRWHNPLHVAGIAKSFYES